MDEGIAGAVADWETRPFADGYRGLHELADASFSGAVEASGAWALFINGRVVGVYEDGDDPDPEPADIERFEGASGTAYEAPHESLPLLFAMQADEGEVVLRNATSDRSLEEVHRELSEEGFTGYLELSEHVLSGDYYVVYQRGNSMSTAFIGNARRLKTGDEAFERAATEAGVYEVRAVPVSVVDVPGPADRDVAGAAGATASEDEPAASGDGDDATGEPADSAAEDEEMESPPTADTDATMSTTRDESPSVDGLDPVGGAPTESGGAETGTSTPSGGAAAGTTASAPDESASISEEPASPEEPTPAVSRIEGTWVRSQLGDADEPVPAVRRIEGTWDASRLDGEDGSAPGAAESGGSTPATATEPAPAAELERLSARVESLADDHERLATTVDRLESRLSGLVADEAGEPFEPTEHRSPEDALAGTRLLVRSQSASEPTLTDVANGAGRASVADNLVFEPRTPFPATETAVDGERFEQFLEGTTAYRFVTWLVATLPFEIRDANRVTALADVYEAIPTIDRATFGTEAALADHAFDVTVRDGEGAPLFVARISESPDPPTESSYEALLRAARDVDAEHDSLAGAFLVTTSYVDESELGPIAEATRGGVLSRDKRESYVSVSGGGFHVCAVEGGETFRLRVPRL